MGDFRGKVPFTASENLKNDDLNIPYPPQTPGPSSIVNLQNKNNVCDRFVAVLWVQVSKIKDNLPDEYLNEYDYFEKFSEKKSYSKRKYLAAFKGQMREYQNYLCIFADEKGNEEYYVVAKKIKSDLEELEPYCNCSKCIANPINPLKYIWCVHCTKCIKAGPGFADSKYITHAKEIKNKIDNDNKNCNNKYSKYFLPISSYFKYNKMKACEYLTISLPIIATTCWFIF